MVKQAQLHTILKMRIVYLGNFNELVVVVLSVEEGFLLEDHAGEHAAQRPHVQGVVVLLEVHQQLGALEVAGRHAHVVLLACRTDRRSDGRTDRSKPTQ
jgi:hypothetical protein